MYKSSYNNDYFEAAMDILDSILRNHQDELGIITEESRPDYKNIFESKSYVPEGWEGKMPNGDSINSDSTFLDIRSQYRLDPDFSKVETAYKDGLDPQFKYHKFWTQCEVALALGNVELALNRNYPYKPTTIPGDVNNDKKVDLKDYVLLQHYLCDNNTNINTNTADLNSDGIITISDLTMLRDKILG